MAIDLMLDDLDRLPDGSLSQAEVRWLTAEGPVDAARMCLDMLRDPSSTAVVFFVTDDAGRRFRVDLMDDEPIPVFDSSGKEHA